MANLSETATYDPGVYQLETTDPVQGGETGVSNKPLKNLANRTAYLKTRVDALETAQSGNAPTNSPGFTGTPTAPTQALGDNTTKIATTAFVQGTVNGVLNKSVAGGSNVSLTAVEAGNGVLVFTGAITANIAVIVPTVGCQWIVSNRTTGSFTLTLKTAAGTGVTISQGKSIELYCDGTNVLQSTSDFFDTALAGAPTAPTQAAGESSAKLATTAFAQAIGLRVNALRSISSSTALTAADAGAAILVGGVGGATITLPAASSVPVGAAAVLIGTGSVSSTNTIKGAGSDTIGGAFGASTNTAALRGLDAVILISDGASIWRVASDNSQAFLSRQFASGQLLSANGYQKLPGGLIVQWGSSITSDTAGADTVHSFPITFPAACLGIASNAEYNATGGGVPSPPLVGLFNRTQSTFTSNTCGTTNTASSFNYIAIGY